MKVQGTKLNFWTSFKFLYKYLKGHRVQLLAFYIGWLLNTALGIVTPILFGLMINQIVYYSNVDLFLKLSIAFAAEMLFTCILYFLFYQIHAYIRTMFIMKIQNDIFSHMNDADAQYMADAKTGDIITTIQWYTSESLNFIVRNILYVANSIITVLFSAVYIFRISWQIGILSLLSFPLSMLISYFSGKKIRDCSDEQRDKYSDYVSWLFEMLTGLRDIRFLGAERRATHQFVEGHRKMFKTDIKASVVSLTAHKCIEACMLIVQLAIYAFAAWSSFAGNMSIGTFIVVITFVNKLTGGAKFITDSHMDAQNRISNIQKIYDFLHVRSEKSWQGNTDLQISNGAVSFRDVTFAYRPDINVIDSLSLEIKPGEKLALVGESGCGKTTLAYMLIGFYSPAAGNILIDSQNIADCSLSSVRKNIGIVQQDVLLFDDTIRNNLQLGKFGASEAEMISACERAGIWDFIRTLPEGLDTVIGPDGIGVSGGQRQRIAIARIYLKDPKIIIFDEATSALDEETENLIHEVWQNVLKNRTTIIIAHRKNSVMLCERVALLENGRIAEIGIPSEMELHSERFRKLFDIKDDMDSDKD